MTMLTIAGIDTCPHEQEVPWRHDYAELYWLSIIGPTTFLLGRRLAGMVLAREFTIEAEELSLELGLGARWQPNAPLNRSLSRLATFKLAERESDTAWWVRLTVPMLSDKQVRRLPDRLRALHESTYATV